MINDEHSFVQEFLEDTDDHLSDVHVYVIDGDRRCDAAPCSRRRLADERRGRCEVEGVTDELGERPRRLAKAATSVLGLDLAGIDLMPILARIGSMGEREWRLPAKSSWNSTLMRW